MQFNARDLYVSRKKANFEYVAPYMRYVSQSGLLLVIAFAAIVFIDQYIKLVKHTPAEFPLAIVATVVMSLLILYSPFRTFLKPADIIYVMPKQADMVKYIEYCRSRGYLIGMLPFIVGLVLLYIVVDAYELVRINLFISLFLLLKIVVYNILYSVGTLTNQVQVILIRIITKVAVISSVYTTLADDSQIVSYISLAILLIINIFIYFNQKAFFNWQYLIEAEKKKVYRTYRFLNLFVDMPQAQSVTKKRQYLAQFAHNIKFTRSNTFSFLHYLTFVRSEVGGIYIRNIIVGSAIAYIMATSMLWNGYASLFFIIVFMGMNAVQLSTLRQIHQHSVWQNIYPIPLNEQHKQMTVIEIKLLLVASLINIVVPTIPFMINNEWRLVLNVAIAMVAIIVWRIVVINSRVKKKLK